MENREKGEIFATRDGKYAMLDGYITDYFEDRLQKLYKMLPCKKDGTLIGNMEYNVDVYGSALEFYDCWCGDIVGIACSKKQIRNAVINTIDIDSIFYNGVYVVDISEFSNKYGWLVYKPAARGNKQLIFKKKDNKKGNYYIRTKADYEMLCKYLNKKLGMQCTM